MKSSFTKMDFLALASAGLLLGIFLVVFFAPRPALSSSHNDCVLNASKSWNVGGNTCYGSVKTDNDVGGITTWPSGHSLPARDTSGTITGRAHFRCNNGTWGATNDGGTPLCYLNGASCSGQSVSWSATYSGNITLTCSDSISGVGNGSFSPAHDTQGDIIGWKGYECNNGTWQNLGRTCYKDCDAGDYQWTVNGRTCTDYLPKDNSSRYAYDNSGTDQGKALYSCNPAVGGPWTLQSGASCGRSCSNANKSWNVGGNTCYGSVSSRPHDGTRVASDNSGDKQGSATYKCNDQTWDIQTGATCVAIAAPTVTLERSIDSGVSWSGSNVNITGSQQVRLRWSSTGATSCTHTGGSGFYANAVSGNDNSINEPSTGNSHTYSISCTGAGGTVTDSITVTKSTPPTVALERSIDSGVSWSGSNVTITSSQQVRLRWTSSNATSCSGTGSGFSASAVSGSDINITEPTVGNSITYTVTCSGAGGSASDSITVTRPAVPTVTLERSIDNGFSWSGSNVNITGSQQVRLKWSSTDATSCTHTGGSGFYANAVSGNDNSINEPSAGNSRTYSISCTGGGGTVTDSITVTKPTLPTATLQIKAFGSWGTNDVTITESDGIALKWNSTDATGCSGTGSGFSASAASGTDWQITEPTAGNSITYTVTCSGAGGSDSDSITVTKPVACTASSSVIWSVGDDACDNALTAEDHGDTVTLTSNNSANEGTATYECNAGTWDLQSDYTCDRTRCSGGTRYWSVGGNDCSVNGSWKDNGFTTSVTDTSQPYTGQATFLCNDTVLTLQSGATCVVNTCPAGTHTWHVGSKSCSGSVAETDHNDLEIASDNDILPGNPGGAAVYRCDNDTWSKVSATCEYPNCPAETKTWGTNCSAIAPETAAGESVIVQDDTWGMTGQATFDCVEGVWDGASYPSCYDSCDGTNQSWTVGSDICSGTVPDEIHNVSRTASDTTPPLTGSATYLCSNGAWTAQSGDTCNTNVDTCPAGARTWGAGCVVSVPETNSGESVTVEDDTWGMTGQAIFHCTNGAWEDAINQSCHKDCSATTESWVVGGNVCAAHISNQSHGLHTAAEDITVPNTGSVNFLCNEGVWEKQAGATCSIGSAACPVETKTWSSNCVSATPVADSGRSITINDTGWGHTGSATFNCTNGVWSGATYPSCHISCVVQSQTWIVDGRTCDGSVSSEIHTISSTADDTSAPNIGQATYQCDNGVWDGPQGVSCCVANHGNTCVSMTNICGQTATGTIQCDGTCSASAPSVPLSCGDVCDSPPNDCGQTNTGNIQCLNDCSVNTPPNPVTYGNVCISASNYCGDIATGTIGCLGNCSVTQPSHSVCLRGYSISVSPSIVKWGEKATLTYDVGLANPAWCELSGPTNFTTFTSTTTASTMEVTVYGPHIYTLTCRIAGQEIRDQARISTPQIGQET